MSERSADRARRSDPQYRVVTRTLFVAGLATFAAMYCTQALLPELSDDLGVSPAASALSVSVTTGAIALAIIPMSVASERFGRTRLMIISTVAFTLIGLVLAFSPSFGWLLAGRAAQGVALAGVPAVAMAYLAEEIDIATLGEAMGRYVAGTTLGGLCGRVLPSLVLEVGSWRWALGSVGVLVVGLSAYFVARLPPSRHFRPRAVSVRSTVLTLAAQLRDVRLLCLFGLAFVLMGGFVSAYNYLGYRLIAPPFDVPPALIGVIFFLYLSGTVTSALAGRWADSQGRGPVMATMIAIAMVGLAVTIVDQLAVVIVGMLLFTGGFFGAHTVASGWVGAIATAHRAEASSLYLFSYYLGSSVLGALAGVAFASDGWVGVLVFVAVGLVIAAVLVAVLVVASRRGTIEDAR